MLAISDSNLILFTQLNVKYISGACAVLHNLAIIFREPLIDEDCDVDGSFQGQYIGPEDGKNIRNYITQNYF